MYIDVTMGEHWTRETRADWHASHLENASNWDNANWMLGIPAHSSCSATLTSVIWNQKHINYKSNTYILHLKVYISFRSLDTFIYYHFTFIWLLQSQRRCKWWGLAMAGASYNEPIIPSLHISWFLWLYLLVKMTRVLFSQRKCHSKNWNYVDSFTRNIF